MSRPTTITITVAEYERLKRDRRAFILATSRSIDRKRNASDRAYLREAAGTKKMDRAIAMSKEGVRRG